MTGNGSFEHLVIEEYGDDYDNYDGEADDEDGSDEL